MSSQSNKIIKKLLLTGSHAGSTAIAVIEEIKKRNLNYEIHWIGKKYAEEGKDTKTLEYNNLTKYGVIFHDLETGKIQTKFTKHTIPALLRIPLGFIKGFKLVKQINPDLTFSFGSSAGAISAFWSSFLGIPVIIHEQTATAGRSNIVSSYFSKKILLARESSIKFFNKNKVEVVGNPTNRKIIELASIKRNSRVKTVLVTGGSRGSTWINDAVKPLLPRLLEKYYVIHQTGEANLNDFKDIKSDKYFAFGQTDPTTMAEVKQKADIVITRSGANVVADLILLKKPSILIPIPWSFNNEQEENAKSMVDLGLGVIINQSELSPHKLNKEIESLIGNYSTILSKTENIVSSDLNASENVVNVLEEFLK